MGFDPTQLRSNGVQLLCLNCRERAQSWYPTRPRRQRAGMPGLPGLPSLLRTTQVLPSPAGEGCALSLTLYLPWGLVAVPVGLVRTEAALDPHAHISPPDLDRHVVDEWWDSLVFIHSVGQDREGQANQAHLFAQRKEAGPTHL